MISDLKNQKTNGVYDRLYAEHMERGLRPMEANKQAADELRRMLARAVASGASVSHIAGMLDVSTTVVRQKLWGAERRRKERLCSPLELMADGNVATEIWGAGPRLARTILSGP